MRNLILLILVINLIGCVAMGDKFVELEEPEQGKAIVYVYHPKDDAYGANEANFLFLDEKQIFRFTHNGYSYFSLEPGTYNFNIRLSTFFVATELVRDSVNLNVKAGETYYLRYYESHDRMETWSNGVSAGAYQLTTANIEEVEKYQALPELSSKRLLNHKMMR
ncbi:DUF2846 domain-containing protein [Pseudoalteromonas sp. NBT06-2]|uniref:DUF2846 domain-containing protein n=1 Tax=Pseudoalteromonas sp. NBT06-2 TaxID=2025950 RepID=UPI0014822EA9|nr:DUF2846 domain-containing protein [Pseudoalteromonas sp. NBT06-2]